MFKYIIGNKVKVTVESYRDSVICNCCNTVLVQEVHPEIVEGTIVERFYHETGDDISLSYSVQYVDPTSLIVMRKRFSEEDLNGDNN